MALTASQRPLTRFTADAGGWVQSRQLRNRKPPGLASSGANAMPLPVVAPLAIAPLASVLPWHPPLWILHWAGCFVVGAASADMHLRDDNALEERDAEADALIHLVWLVEIEVLAQIIERMPAGGNGWRWARRIAARPHTSSRPRAARHWRLYRSGPCARHLSRPLARSRQRRDHLAVAAALAKLRGCLWVSIGHAARHACRRRHARHRLA